MARQTRTQKPGNGAVQSRESPELRSQIQKRAYEIWMSSGRGHGNDVAHWLQAESEVLVNRHK